MRAVVTGGSTGQLRWELERTRPIDIEAVFLTRELLDVTNASAVMSVVAEYNPDVIINASAYTAVDKAETDRDAAFAVNTLGVENLATAADALGARLVHVSTDFVFDGQSSSPYSSDATTCPIGVYGESKLAGEQVVQSILGGRELIVRTSWVYSSFGNNFVKTMLKLMSERDELGVIADQVGTPTWARGLAEMLWHSVEEEVSGVHHWTDAGITSWYDFAVAIYEEGRSLGLLDSDVLIKPLTTEQYPTTAKRPAYSVLDKTNTWESVGKVSDHWRVSLRKMLQEL